MYRQLCAMVVLLLGGLLLGLPTLCAAQEPPPVTGTIALEGTVDKIYAAANTVVVKATDGVEHLFHLTKRTVVHGTKNAGDAALSGLTEGNRVVVHYVAGAEEKTAIEVDHIAEGGLGAIEGVVTRVDREGKKLSIRLADGSTETLRLSERAATDVGKDVDRAADRGAKVIVYYTDEAGNRVAHYFKRIS
jgi:flagellar hook-associated protein FlgK